MGVRVPRLRMVADTEIHRAPANRRAPARHLRTVVLARLTVVPLPPTGADRPPTAEAHLPIAAEARPRTTVVAEHPPTTAVAVAEAPMAEEVVVADTPHPAVEADTPHPVAAEATANNLLE